MAKYICIEGTDGVGKGTQLDLLIKYLTEKGFRVLLTSEPGTKHLPETMKLREKVLSNDSAKNLSVKEREEILQKIREIHLKELIRPNLDKYDYIIQDRGILSGFAYAMAQDLDFDYLKELNQYTLEKAGIQSSPFGLYYQTILFTGNDASQYLEKAKSAKKEYESGDFLEDKGGDFMEKVRHNFLNLAPKFNNLDIINIENDTNTRKSIKEVFELLLKTID